MYHGKLKQQSLWKKTGKWDKGHCQYNSPKVITHLDEKRGQLFQSLLRNPSPFCHQLKFLSISSQQSPHHLVKLLYKPQHILLCQPYSLQPRKKRMGASTLKPQQRKQRTRNWFKIWWSKWTWAETIGGNGDFFKREASPSGFLGTMFCRFWNNILETFFTVVVFSCIIFFKAASFQRKQPFQAIGSYIFHCNSYQSVLCFMQSRRKCFKPIQEQKLVKDNSIINCLQESQRDLSCSDWLRELLLHTFVCRGL